MEIKFKNWAIHLSKKNAEPATVKKSKPLAWTPRATDTTRKDIQKWKQAWRLAENGEQPSNARLQNLYNTATQDALLSSQINNRISKVFNVNFSLINENGEPNDEQTELLYTKVPWREIHKSILETIYFEYSLGQFQWIKNSEGTDVLTWQNVPRENVVPQKGWFLKDLSDLNSKPLLYRQQREFGTWWLEFGNAQERGLLNKAVPHVIIKNFAQSCWAELCEIIGIPPRVLKTQTHNEADLKRARQMMEDMGTAAWFIIDKDEDFSFANGANTNGEVYRNLIQLCSNEISMLISGAIIGQDTINGSRSKDESAQTVLWELVQQDLVLLEQNYNNIVIPALKKLGVLQGDLTLQFDIPEDLELLWERVRDTQNTFEFDQEWLNEKFGLQITGVKNNGGFATPNLSYSEDFFV